VLPRWEEIISFPTKKYIHSVFNLLTLYAINQGIWKVITASSVGTLIEWYDFYIFGSLSTIIASKFFPSTNPTAALLSTLATFAAGFIVRPFGALVFGRLGDIIGRKYTFLLTLVLMGGSTFLIGCIPAYATIGGGRRFWCCCCAYCRAWRSAVSMAGRPLTWRNMPPANRRGYFTSWIQTTATLGLFLSLVVILGIRRLVGVEEFTTATVGAIPSCFPLFLWWYLLSYA